VSVRRIVIIFLLFSSLDRVSAAPNYSGLGSGRPLLDSTSQARFHTAQTFSTTLQEAIHNINKLYLVLDNYGAAYSGVYPILSNSGYLYKASLWIGCVKDGDTLVSSAAQGIGDYNSEYGFYSEFFPQRGAAGDMVYRSSLDQKAPEFKDAVAEQEFESHNCDTFTSTAPYSTIDYLSKRRHKPIGVEVTRKSYGWSFAYAEDIVMLDYRITNLSNEPLTNVYVALSMDPDVWWDRPNPPGTQVDDVVGFRRTFPSSGPCGGTDTIDIGWGADNDGDPVDGHFNYGGSPRSVTAVTGITCLGSTIGSEPASFNWWTYDTSNTRDYGPRAQPTSDKPFRDFHTGGLGVPYGDANKLYLMSNEEFDFDQVYVRTIGVADANWMFPPFNNAKEISVGADSWFVLSYGPFPYIAPGDSINIAFAYVAGENFHRNPNELQLLKEGRIQEYYNGLDFSDLAKNVAWAKRIYDIPGVDTDSDGYAGEAQVCVMDSILEDGHWVPSYAETTWVKGDGIPDWRGPSPPPAPMFWVIPIFHGFKIRFNGYFSETTRDVFTNMLKFEGYRIYMGLDEREESMSLMASYDKLNFDKIVWDPTRGESGGWELQDIPMTLDQIRCLYGAPPNPCLDSNFDPLSYTMTRAFHPKDHFDSAFYFVKHDMNTSVFGKDTPIRKIYPDAPKPAPADSSNPDIYTSDGYLKYYEYEYEVTDLLPTISYFFNVTAFDFGTPKVGLFPLESSKTLGMKQAYPLGDHAKESGGKLPIYVFPNPYRSDGKYRDQSYEDRKHEGMIDDKVRRINFVNVPPKCTIRILTLDGDLVKTIIHDMDPNDNMSSYAYWDVINKNTQTVTSGLYYWSVEGEDGKVQIGKLVIIR
jgi:hypothetical protein